MFYNSLSSFPQSHIFAYEPTNSSQSDQLTRRNEWDKTLYCEFEQRLLNYSNNYS